MTSITAQAPGDPSNDEVATCRSTTDRHRGLQTFDGESGQPMLMQTAESGEDAVRPAVEHREPQQPVAGQWAGEQGDDAPAQDLPTPGRMSLGRMPTWRS
jgi:hypothetical protein